MSRPPRSRPPVSVVVPAYNAARFLRDAITSVREQGYAPLEIIVVDDGSADETPELLRALAAPGFRRIWQENAGPSAARNRGIEAATGEVIAFIDADDLWPAGKLELQVNRLVADPSLEVVSGRVQYFAQDGRSLDGYHFESEEQALLNINLGAAVFRREVFDRIGLFDEELRFSEDHDWFLRAREQSVRLVVLEESTLRYRLHTGNVTRGRSVRDLMLPQVLKRSLERRRRRGQGSELPSWSAFDAKGTRKES